METKGWKEEQQRCCTVHGEGGPLKKGRVGWEQP